MKFYSFLRFQSHNLRFYWLAQGLLIILMIQSTWLQSADAHIIGSDLLCHNVSLDFRCKSYRLAQQPTDASEYTDAHQPALSQVIKFKLNDLAGVAEWIRVEVTDGNQVKLLHTVVSESGVSRAVRRLIPVPLPVAIAHTWYDHPTSRITFQPDGCESNDCLITGTNLVTLPVGTDIYQGRFTLEYTESGWLRTVTFKIPQQNKTAAHPSSSAE
jgi:hypothetical protein